MKCFFLTLTISLFLNVYSIDAFKEMNIQIESYSYATSSSYTPLSDEDHELGHYGGERELHKKTGIKIYQLSNGEALKLLNSKLIFSSVYKNKKEDITLKEYVLKNAKNDVYDVQMKEYLSKDLDKRRYYYSEWFDPLNMSPHSLVLVRINGEVVYVDNLFYRSEYLSNFPQEASVKVSHVEEELVDFILQQQEITSCFPKIKNETIFRVKHFSGTRIESDAVVNRFGEFTHREYTRSTISRYAKNSEIELLLEEIQKYNFKKVDRESIIMESEINRSMLEGDKVFISLLVDGRTKSFLLDASNKNYTQNLIKLEEFTLKLFKYISDQR